MVIMLVKILLPAILTVVCNILFYLLVKKRVDKSIEEHKINYNGIFKEKIEIYQNILEKSYNLKYKIDNYYKNGNLVDVEIIFSEIHDFILYYLKCQPFLSINMLKALKKIQVEFQFIFENSYEYHSATRVSGIEPTTIGKIEEKFIEVNKRNKN